MAQAIREIMLLVGSPRTSIGFLFLNLMIYRLNVFLNSIEVSLIGSNEVFCNDATNLVEENTASIFDSLGDRFLRVRALHQFSISVARGLVIVSYRG